jgi:hypothetical protein
MSGTNFIDKNTVITAEYMNGVDRAVYDAIGDGESSPSSPTEVKVNLGLNNVDNTSDVNKPISAATQIALDLKASITAATGAVQVPTGTTAQRPTGVEGLLRRNAELDQWEGYDGAQWAGIGGASGAGGNPFCDENDITVTADYTITTDKNAMSAGPITLGSGVTVTVPSGSTWSIV